MTSKKTTKVKTPKTQAEELASDLYGYIDTDEGDLGCVGDAAELLLEMDKERQEVLTAWRNWDGQLGTAEYRRLESAIEDLD